MIKSISLFLLFLCYLFLFSYGQTIQSFERADKFYLLHGSNYTLAEYKLTFTEDMEIARGSLCPPSPYTASLCSGEDCEDDCLRGCNYASSSACGTVDPSFVNYDACASFACPPRSFSGLRLCQDTTTWVDLRAESQLVSSSTNTTTTTTITSSSSTEELRNQPARLMQGATQDYRVYLPDTRHGLQLFFHISAGRLSMAGNFYDPDSRAVPSAFLFLIPYARGATPWTICPASQRGFSAPSLLLSAAGQSATFFFQVTALESAVYSISMAPILPLPSSSLLPLLPACASSFAASLPCPLADSHALHCPSAASCLGRTFSLSLPASSLPASPCVPVLVQLFLLGEAAEVVDSVELLLSRQLPLTGPDDAEVLSHAPSTSVFLCPGETLYVLLSRFKGPALLTLSASAASFELLPFSAMDPYSAATSDLMGSLVRRCTPASSTPSAAPLQTHCGAYEWHTCPSFLPALGQVDAIPWPPLPSVGDATDGWSEQGVDQLSSLFSPSNLLPNTLQWIEWRAVQDAADLAPRPLTDSPDLNTAQCAWLISPSLRTVTSQRTLAPFSSSSSSSTTPTTTISTTTSISSLLPNEPSQRPLSCTADVFLVEMTRLTEVIARSLQFMDAEALAKLNYLAQTEWYHDVFDACFGLGLSLYNETAVLVDTTTDLCLRAESTDPAFATDPCCSFEASLDSCCLPREMTLAIDALDPDLPDIAARCATDAECVASFLNEYAQWAMQQLGTLGCEQIYTLAAANIKASRDAVASCSLLAFSSDESHTWRCTSDDDCPAGHPCNFYNGRCDYNRSQMESDFVDCLFGPSPAVSSFVIGLMAQHLNVSLADYPISTGAFAQKVLSNYSNWDCVPNDDLGITSRRSYSYLPVESDCWDYCDTTYDLLPKDPPACLDPYCAIPLECQSPFAVCDREWYYNSYSESTCWGASNGCNWFDVQNCPSASECLTDCAGATLAANQFCGFCFDAEQLNCVDTGIPLAQCASYHACAFPNGTIDILPVSQPCPASCSEQCASPTGPTGYASSNPDMPHLCYSPATSSDDCYAIPGAIWQADRRANSGFCQLPQFPLAVACANHGYEWATCDSERADRNCALIPGCTPYPSAILELLSCGPTQFHPCADQASCESAGSCTDKLLLINRLVTPPIFGACVHPFNTSNAQYRCPDTSHIPSYLGCVDWTITLESQCVSPSQWMLPIDRPTNETCTAIKACTDGSYLSENDCTACDLDYVSVFEWDAAFWAPSQSKSLMLIERQIVKQTGWVTSLDIHDLTEDVIMYSDIDSSFLNRAGFLCSSLPILKVEMAAAFGCAPDSTYTSNLPASPVLNLAAISVVCPGEETRLLGPNFEVIFNHFDPLSSSPLSGLSCPIIFLDIIPASVLKAPPPKPTASLFSKYPPQIPYEVENPHHQAVGQAVGDGFAVIFYKLDSHAIAHQDVPLPKSKPEYQPFMPNYTVSYSNLDTTTSYDAKTPVGANVLICIMVDASLVETLDPSFTVWDFASKNGRELTPLMLNVTYDGTTLCGKVPEVFYGDSFTPIKRVTDPFASQEPLFSTSELGIIFTTSALYFLILIVLIYRLAYLIYLGELFTMQSIFPACLSIFDIFRGVYFALLGAEQLVGISSAVNFALIDIPYFFFFLGMSLLLWWWVSLVYTRDRQNVVRNFHILTLSSSAVFITLLVVVGVLYKVLEESPIITCNGRLVVEQSGLSNQDILLITEKCVLCFLTLLGGLLFVITGQQLRIRTMKTVERQVTFITWIAFLSFFGQSLYFILLVVTDWSTSAYSLIPLWFIEILPQPFMLYFQPATRTRQSSRSTSSQSRTRSLSRLESDNHHSSQLIELSAVEPHPVIYTGQDEQ